MSDASHASGAHESHAAHAHEVYEGTPADTIPPDEPHTPGWLPIVGIGLALAAILTFAVRHEDTASAAGAASAAPRGCPHPSERATATSTCWASRGHRSAIAGHPVGLHATASGHFGAAAAAGRSRARPGSRWSRGSRPGDLCAARRRGMTTPGTATNFSAGRGARKVVAFSAIVWQSLRHLRGCSPVGRALAWHARGQGFDSLSSTPKFLELKKARPSAGFLRFGGSSPSPRTGGGSQPRRERIAIERSATEADFSGNAITRRAGALSRPGRPLP